jgi:transposase
MSTNRRKQQARARAAKERAARQARREHAAELFAQGASQAEVARQLEVSAQAVSVWHARWREGGTAALDSRGPSGPAPRLSDAQLATVEQALLKARPRTGSPESCGPWTASPR